MVTESTQKLRAKARGHMKTSTFGRRPWILGVGIGIGIGVGICGQHESVQQLTEVDPDTDPDAWA